MAKPDILTVKMKLIMLNDNWSLIRSAGRMLLLGGFLLFSGAVRAQTEGEETAAEPEKADVSLELRYTEANNSLKMLTAIVKANIDDSWVPAVGVPVAFYRQVVAPENRIGTAVTGKKGMAVLDLPAGETDKFESPAQYVFVAAVEDQEKYSDSEEELTVAEADMEMTLETEDSVHTVVITLTGADESGERVPVADPEVRILVKRLFGLLPITEDAETTDETGEVRVEFPGDIPGDSLGNVIIVARIDEHERYGFLENRKKVNWGVPVVASAPVQTRELWSSRANAPIYLIVFVNVMLTGIWGVVFYIIYDIFKIRKIGKNQSVTPETR